MTEIRARRGGRCPVCRETFAAGAMIAHDAVGWCHTECSPASEGLSRADVLARASCPACRAESGSPCVGVRGKPRASLHRERWKTAITAAERQAALAARAAPGARARAFALIANEQSPSGGTQG